MSGCLWQESYFTWQIEAVLLLWALHLISKGSKSRTESRSARSTSPLAVARAAHFGVTSLRAHWHLAVEVCHHSPQRLKSCNPLI